jgi:hypothetical protein
LIWPLINLGGGKGRNNPGLQGYNGKSNDVCRVGGFTTNSKPIVKEIK